jgi:hypothetical protein
MSTEVCEFLNLLQIMPRLNPAGLAGQLQRQDSHLRLNQSPKSYTQKCSGVMVQLAHPAAGVVFHDDGPHYEGLSSGTRLLCKVQPDMFASATSAQCPPHITTPVICKKYARSCENQMLLATCAANTGKMGFRTFERTRMENRCTASNHNNNMQYQGRVHPCDGSTTSWTC